MSFLPGQSTQGRPAREVSHACRLFIDAGVEELRFFAVDAAGRVIRRMALPAGDGPGLVAAAIAEFPGAPLVLTGKLRSAVMNSLGRGTELEGDTALWLGAARRAGGKSTAAVDLSASGYTVVGLEPDGRLKNDLLINSPRCGAGPGLNLDRVLQKLNVRRDQVDALLAPLLGKAGEGRRKEVPVRADRCGVFASSATVSDKNQGIPTEFALAATLKSEVLKACKQVVVPFATIWLTGGVFRWQFCRDCAADYFHSLGVDAVRHDREQTLPLDGMLQMLENHFDFLTGGRAVANPKPLDPALPSFLEVKERLTDKSLFFREAAGELAGDGDIHASERPLLLAIDMGSTMAKLVVATPDGTVLRRSAYGNSGDTLEILKKIFGDLSPPDCDSLSIAGLGLTGSARYQVRKVLLAVYPELAGRVSVLVENYAHAYGALEHATAHVKRLREAGCGEVNTDLCLLVDVGGEDTKVSTIDLHNGKLVDNAMNDKCSAGTGSLFDTLVAIYRMPDVGQACREAFEARGAHDIEATCAVLLMEHARRLQAEGYDRPEILASAIWAIAENMARSLWTRIRLPANPVVLLHGQTMLGEPLPLAVAHRLQDFLQGRAFCLVPPDPGHRACLGLIKTLVEEGLPEGTVRLAPRELIARNFTRQLVVCRGASCRDTVAHCYRSRVTAVDAAGERLDFTLGGCALINEPVAKSAPPDLETLDTYHAIWQFADKSLPVSDDPERLVIPRSFAVSEWAALFAALFEPVGIPVHTDTVCADDILRAQPYFRIDTCAPHIGAVGQFLRLAGQPHGMILAPQIEFLPSAGGSLGRTCTINQGGMAVARSIAKTVHAGSRIHLFHLDLKPAESDFITYKLHARLQPVYAYYGVEMSSDRFRVLFAEAMQRQKRFRSQLTDFASGLARRAMAAGQDIALVIGREYVLNPGVFDSHVGRLLRDKGLAGFPGYLLDVEGAPEFRHLYWRNAHQLATLAAAAARKTLHQTVHDPSWRQIFRQVEEREDRLLPVVQVSTFLCGPDSVTSPLVDQLVQNRPYLRLQSDAAIQELAHLENRMNTYVRQLVEKGRQAFFAGTAEHFDVALLQDFVHVGPLDPVRDVLCFPTLGDIRPVLAVLRSAGFTCLDNYDETFDLPRTVRRGRSVVGDSVCTPLAAVYGDILQAAADFRRKRAEDPDFAGKKRLLIFNNKGLGPCRQGQYVEVHKLFLRHHGDSGGSEEGLLRFLVGHENQGFAGGFPRWLYWRAVQAAILQGVLHQLLADGSARCRNREEQNAFRQAYLELKAELNRRIEARPNPASYLLALSGRVSGLPGIGPSVEYLASGLHRNPLAGPLRAFHRRWCRKPLDPARLRIHVEGEAYMRTAQFEMLHEALLDILGFEKFSLSYTPVWSFLEYKLAGMMLRSREGIAEGRREMQQAHSGAFRRNRRTFLWKKRRRLLSLVGAHGAMRHLLAAPLYRAAGVTMPESMPEVLEVATQVVPTRRPGGELVPYVGEIMLKLQAGYDLVLNVAPEGCMVSSMGEVLTPAIRNALPDRTGRILPVFSGSGEIDRDQLRLALLKVLGPYRLYGGEPAGTLREK